MLDSLPIIGRWLVHGANTLDRYLIVRPTRSIWTWVDVQIPAGDVANINVRQDLNALAQQTVAG